jgi:hypothetical protein
VQQLRGSVGRTRFLLALSLSTVTAVAVAAPLALQAMNAEQPTTVDPVGPGAGGSSGEDLLSDSDGDRSLEGDGESQGGIGARPNPKALSETGKSGDPTDTSDSDPSGDIGDPDQTTTTQAASTTTEPVEEGSSGRPAPEPSVADPTSTTSTTEDAVPTVIPEPTTSSTDPSTTSSSIESGTPEDEASPEG